YRDALWKENQVSIFVKPPKPSFQLNPNKQSWSKWEWYDVVADWNWASEKRPLDVSVYSSCDEVELFLNGKSLGRKQTNRETQFTAIYKVPFQAGPLKAVGYSKGKVVASSELKTAKQVARLKLTCDRNTINADAQDLAYVTVELVDATGTRNPKAENLVNFSVNGGTIVGVGNANPVSLESYQLPRRKAWQGKCLVILKSKEKAGNITLTATSPGLPPAKLAIKTK